MALPPTSFLTGLAVWLGLATGKPCKGVISLRRVPALRTEADTPRRYFIYRTYGTRSTPLPYFWRYRHVVPNGTGGAGAAGDLQALKGPGRSVISLRSVPALRTIATPWRGFYIPYLRHSVCFEVQYNARQFLCGRCITFLPPNPNKNRQLHLRANPEIYCKYDLVLCDILFLK
ncbi:MAG: hypothetical protein RIF40_27905 [Imperialibacter sp.]